MRKKFFTWAETLALQRRRNKKFRASPRLPLTFIRTKIFYCTVEVSTWKLTKKSAQSFFLRKWNLKQKTEKLSVQGNTKRRTKQDKKATEPQFLEWKVWILSNFQQTIVFKTFFSMVNTFQEIHFTNSKKHKQLFHKNLLIRHAHTWYFRQKKICTVTHSVHLLSRQNYVVPVRYESEKNNNEVWKT